MRNFDYSDSEAVTEEFEMDAPRGSNFLVSAVMMLKRQKAELQEENQRLRARLQQLESHNAHFINLSADRLLSHRPST